MIVEDKMFAAVCEKVDDGLIQEGMDEASLIRSAAAGDLSAFNCLAAAHQDGLYWWVFSLTRDEALAEDLTQSTLITAFQKISTFRDGSFRGWLFTIARNRSYDELRRQKRYPTLSLDDSPEDDHDLLSILPASAPLPEDILESGERSALIVNLLNRLPVMFQEVLRLVDMEGLDYREAADILGLPLGTLKSRITRARHKLSELVERSGYF
jgi:RNA polymerase sigma-70 factor, ECF subfamily